MTIEEYIKSKDIFRLMPFTTIYVAICELINDGFIEQSAFKKGGGESVAISEPESEWEECRRLYGSRYFFSDR